MAKVVLRASGTHVWSEEPGGTWVRRPKETRGAWETFVISDDWKTVRSHHGRLYALPLRPLPQVVVAVDPFEDEDQEALKASIHTIYLEELFREPDKVGLDFYARKASQDDWTVAKIREDIRASPEWAKKHPLTPKPTPGRSSLTSDLVSHPYTGSFLYPYFGPSILSCSESIWPQLLAKRKSSGAIHLDVYLQWIYRKRFFDHGWAGDFDINTFENTDSLVRTGRLLDLAIEAGLTPNLVLHDRGASGSDTDEISPDILIQRCETVVEQFAGKFAWIIPEFEIDERRSSTQYGSLFHELRARHSHVAFHGSEHMDSIRADQFAKLPADCLILLQGKRSDTRMQLQAYTRQVVSRAGGRTVVAYEHSAAEGGAAQHHQYTESRAADRAVACCVGGARGTGNVTTPKARVLCNLVWRPDGDQTIHSITEAFTHDLPTVMPGIIRVSKDTIWYPGLRGGVGDPDSERIDISSAGPPRRWRTDWGIEPWDGVVRPWEGRR
tara:strand:- start:808 stop:2298 length:1491 start_codon:yes stop_codon:yes gene_type:complete